jgi:hypothetical protein
MQKILAFLHYAIWNIKHNSYICDRLIYVLPGFASKAWNKIESNIAKTEPPSLK